MTQITLRGKTFNLAHHLGAEMSYFDIAGRNLSPSEILGGEDQEPNPTALLKLVAAQIISNDNEAEFVVESDIMRNPSRHEVQEAMSAAIREYITYATMPGGAEAHVAEPSTNEAEEEVDEKKA